MGTYWCVVIGAEKARHELRWLTNEEREELKALAQRLTIGGRDRYLLETVYDLDSGAEGVDADVLLASARAHAADLAEWTRLSKKFGWKNPENLND